MSEERQAGAHRRDQRLGERLAQVHRRHRAAAEVDERPFAKRVAAADDGRRHVDAQLGLVPRGHRHVHGLGGAGQGRREVVDGGRLGRHVARRDRDDVEVHLVEGVGDAAVPATSAAVDGRFSPVSRSFTSRPSANGETQVRPTSTSTSSPGSRPHSQEARLRRGERVGQHVLRDLDDVRLPVHAAPAVGEDVQASSLSTSTPARSRTWTVAACRSSRSASVKRPSLAPPLCKAVCTPRFTTLSARHLDQTGARAKAARPGDRRYQPSMYAREPGAARDSILPRGPGLHPCVRRAIQRSSHPPHPSYRSWSAFASVLPERARGMSRTLIRFCDLYHPRRYNGQESVASSVGCACASRIEGG